MGRKLTKDEIEVEVKCPHCGEATPIGVAYLYASAEDDPTPVGFDLGEMAGECAVAVTTGWDTLKAAVFAKIHEKHRPPTRAEEAEARGDLTFHRQREEGA